MTTHTMIIVLTVLIVGVCTTGPFLLISQHRVTLHLLTVLAPEVAQAMTPIYQRMSDRNLLERLSKGKPKTLMKHFMVLYGLVVQKQFLLEGHDWKHLSLVELRPSMLEPVTQVMS